MIQMLFLLMLLKIFNDTLSQGTSNSNASYNNADNNKNLVASSNSHTSSNGSNNTKESDKYKLI